MGKSRLNSRHRWLLALVSYAWFPGILGICTFWREHCTFWRGLNSRQKVHVDFVFCLALFGVNIAHFGVSLILRQKVQERPNLTPKCACRFCLLSCTFWRGLAGFGVSCCTFWRGFKFSPKSAREAEVYAKMCMQVLSFVLHFLA